MRIFLNKKKEGEGGTHFLIIKIKRSYVLLRGLLIFYPPPPYTGLVNGAFPWERSADLPSPSKRADGKKKLACVSDDFKTEKKLKKKKCWKCFWKKIFVEIFFFNFFYRIWFFLFRTLFSTLFNTLFRTLFSTLFRTLFNTLFRTLFSTLFSTLFRTLFSTLFNTLFRTLFSTLSRKIFPMSQLVAGAVDLFSSSGQRRKVVKLLMHPDNRRPDFDWGCVLFSLRLFCLSFCIIFLHFHNCRHLIRPIGTHQYSQKLPKNH